MCRCVKLQTKACFYCESGDRKRRQSFTGKPRSCHVAPLHGPGVPGRVGGAGRAAAGGRMGAVRGHDGREDLPAPRRGTERHSAQPEVRPQPAPTSAAEIWAAVPSGGFLPYFRK